VSRTNLFRTELTGVDDTGELQLGSGTGYASDDFDKVHVVRQHGLASHAPKGSHGIGIAGSGERSLVAFLGLEDPNSRPRNLQEGQTVLYDSTGNATRMLGTDGIWHDAGARAQKMTGDTLSLQGKSDVSFGSTGGKTYLGGDGKTGSYARVMTENGPSPFVYARIG
jgi:phage gp45-like